MQVSRLREPRQLFAASNPSLGPQQLARWPAELEVAVERVQHLFTIPQTPEAFYVRSKTLFASHHVKLKIREDDRF